MGNRLFTPVCVDGGVLVGSFSGSVETTAAPRMVSVGRRWQSTGEMWNDLRDPEFKDVAPMVMLDCLGPSAGLTTQALWDAPRILRKAVPPPPQPWAQYFLKSYALKTRVWRGARGEMRPSRDPGWWDVVVRAHVLPAHRMEDGAADVADHSRAAVMNPRRAAGGQPPDDILEFRADEATVVAIAECVPRCGWLFLLLMANGQRYGMLAINDVVIVDHTGPADGAGAPRPSASRPDMAAAVSGGAPRRDARSVAALWRALKARAGLGSLSGSEPPGGSSGAS